MGRTPLKRLSKLGRSVVDPATHRAVAREIAGVGRAVVSYPLGMTDEHWGIRQTDSHPASEQDPDQAPVLLIHGFAHNRSGYNVIKERLIEDGFHNVFTFNYNPFVHDTRRVAERLALRVERICDASGSPYVHLVGHSMGGFVSRYYIQFLGGHERALRVVTLGSPHYGTAILPKPLRFNKAVRQMGWNSALVRHMNLVDVPQDVEWTSIWTTSDELVVPSESSWLDPTRFRAENIKVRGEGHLSLLYTPAVVDIVVDRLGRQLDEHPKFSASPHEIADVIELR